MCYNAFICSLFSHNLIYWFDNNCFGRDKLKEKIDDVIKLLEKTKKKCLYVSLL